MHLFGPYKSYLRKKTEIKELHMLLTTSSEVKS
jgi:hypothetical protein